MQRLLALLVLLAFGCGDDTKPPPPKPVLGLGRYAGLFDDGAAGHTHGLCGLIADAEGRIDFHLDGIADGTFFESNAGGLLVEGAVTLPPITAIGGRGYLTNLSGNAAGGRLDLSVRVGEQGQTPNRILAITGQLGMAGGSGSFMITTPTLTTQGTWQLAPGISPDANYFDAAETD
ncbi:MAG TPA: hypothetical protein VKN99_14960 [Polyangia bacterium]|nr:hypothetical protein [Polyangia bacterium]